MNLRVIIQLLFTTVREKQMKKLLLFCLFLLAGITTYTLQAQSTYRIYLRLTDAGGTLTGPVSSLPGVTGGNFFALGCAEHRFDMPPSGGGANHSPYLVTRSFDPTTSPYIRQRMHSGNSYSEEVFFVRSEEHTSELQSHSDLVCRLLLEKKKKHKKLTRHVYSTN